MKSICLSLIIRAFGIFALSHKPSVLFRVSSDELCKTLETLLDGDVITIKIVKSPFLAETGASFVDFRNA